MVLSNNTWEEETRKTLAQIQTELNDAQKEYEEAKAEVDRLTKEVEAMELALQIHLQRTGKQGVIKQDLRALLASQKNHEERLKRIAEQNNGLLKVSSAADILYSYQLIKSKSRINAYRIIYGIMLYMVEDGIFQKTGPGEFRLIGAQTKLPA
jgi:DNA repair ATPase RecN